MDGMGPPVWRVAYVDPLEVELCVIVIRTGLY